VLALTTTALGTEGLVGFSTATGEVVSRFSLTETSMTVGKSALLPPGASIAGEGTLADGSLWILTRSGNHEVGTIFRFNGSTLTTAVLDATEAALAEAPTGSVEAVEVTRGGNAVAELTLSSADRWQLARSIYLTIPYGSSG
jgi:ethanolamine utilization microcompartment shell protein EutS